MKKLNMFILVSFVPFCLIFSTLKGAEKPLEKPVRVIPRIRGGVEQAILPEPATRLIQEYVMAYKVPIVISNNTKPIIPIKVTIQDVKGKEISSVGLRYLVRRPTRDQIEQVGDAQTIKLPLIPVNITVYLDYGDGKLREIGNFSLSAQELNNIESIEINRHFAKIKTKNGTSYQKALTIGAILFNLQP